MYRHVDAALVRAAAWHPDHQTVWPDLISASADTMSWRAWLQQIWQATDFAVAVTAASPDLASRVEQICAGRSLPSPDVRRTVLAVLRYLLRARTRATPFGLFAGVAAARIGTAPALSVGTGHQAVARPDAAISTALIDRFEQHPMLRPHLMLLASTLAVERDGYVVIEHRPSGTATGGPEHMHVRLTAPIREVLDSAGTPILWGDLASKLSASFPSAPPAAIDRLLSGLVEERVLLTSLRPAMTVTDPLAGLLHHAQHLTPSERGEIREVPRPALDLRVDWDLTVPEAVAQEAAAAAKALTRLAPRAALTGWAEWHGRFVERYGLRAIVPVVDAIDALGYPPGSLGATTPPASTSLPERDGQLIKLAHAAGMRHRLEVELDDAALEDLATTNPGHPVQPSTELTVRIDAASVADLQQGKFTLHVVGVARSAGATAGRFLGMLDDADRRRMTEVYAGLPGVHQDSLVAQISSTPLSLRAENVARAPQAADLVISLGDYQSPDTSLVPVTDLAVTADAERLHLVSISRRRPVHTLLLNAVDLGHHSHPLARFLTEAPVALAVPCTGFMWGTAASNLPFLPALRYGRTILSPARWLLTHDDLPAAATPWPQWDDTLAQWRRDVHLPERVYLSEADQCIALDLTESSHRVLLRTHLDRDGKVTLRPAPQPQDLGWTGGRAHEVVIPLATDQDVAPVRAQGHVLSREHGHLPGCDDRIYLQLHGHRDRQNAVLTRHLPALLEELDGLQWWFVRYRDPDDHLRVRLTYAPGALGSVFEHTGEWTRRLRRHGLITHASVETYHPETARFGGPTAIDAAERYFAADSAATLAQLTAQAESGGTDARAVTAASMVDIATGLLGDSATAMAWLIEHTRTTPAAPPRAVYHQAVNLVNTHTSGLGECVTAAWSARREALTAYRRALTDADVHPHDLLPDLLHLHQVRMRGPDLAEERTHLHLARAAALSWTARARRTS
ncbi:MULTISPECIES: lantibiotic dehydratase [unclassified Streptomyces]|uniref:lantibiotic dehydratase n=1 Tax=unclassified Streptomyces TaxID=2593676 RepID=UPI001BE6D999|nr:MULTISPECIES: lantibiotic dehydratase [unclassified Streptomyces]MBT2405593.1 lantibiotic dehydratase [Streptomyces sp. ISL-21]MBT2607727.1 lantibiotic dehydratase [Streptomyces sp. ISL-87]